MVVRQLEKPDINNALALVWRVFLSFEAPDYAEEGVSEFKAFISYDSITQKMQAGTLVFWGCFENGVLLGVIAVRDQCHICLLFVDKAHHRRGIARRLFEIVKLHCQSGGAEKITVYSSPYAAEAYRHLGFCDTDAEQTVNGIRFIPMTHWLGRNQISDASITGDL